MYNNELYHYGVKGMKWKGHVYATREELKNAKRAYKAEKKEFKRARNEIKMSVQYEHAATHKARTIVGGYLKGGLGATLLTAAALAPAVSRGKISLDTASKITGIAGAVGSTYGVANGALDIIIGKKRIEKRANSKLKNVAATAVYGLDSNGVRNDQKKRTVMNEKHSRRQKGNI